MAEKGSLTVLLAGCRLAGVEVVGVEDMAEMLQLAFSGHATSSSSSSSDSEG